MTNEEAIKGLNRKNLASILIRNRFEEEWDYDYGEEPYFRGYRTILVTSDGLEYDELDYKDALEHECWWLAQEAVVCGVRD